VTYTVKNHLLYKGNERVSYKLSPNRGGVIKPELVVIHYTGDNGTGGLNWLTTKGSGVSAHLWIAKTGIVWQLLPFNIRGWHAGRSEYDGRGDVNSWSVGIENQGLGDVWPEKQIQANIDVIKALCAVYDIVDLVGHDEVAIPEGRKVDPGERYPWRRIGDACGFQWAGV
jgi:N-acetylmuramoyl-L-alanine amidase